jgi:hypothetical protein
MGALLQVGLELRGRLTMQLAQVEQEFHFQVLEGAQGDKHRGILGLQGLLDLGQCLTFQKGSLADLGNQVKSVTTARGHQVGQRRRTLRVGLRVFRIGAHHFHGHKGAMLPTDHAARTALEHEPGLGSRIKPVGRQGAEPGHRLQLLSGLATQVPSEAGQA